MSEIESSSNIVTQTPENTGTIVSAEPPTEPPKTPETLEKPKKSKKKIVIITIVALVLAAGITALIIFLCNQSKNDQPTAQQAEELTNNATLEKYRLKDNSLSDFDLAFLKMENEEKNKIYSPLSIKYALGMLKEGTAGNSYTQIDTVIGDYKAKSYLNSKNRSLANVMFVRDSFKENVKDSYITGLKDKFNASVIYDPFTNATAINNWVSEKTLDQIKNLVSDDAVSDKTFALINALAIDMQWVNRIQCADVENDTGSCIYNGISYNVKYNHENYKSNISRVRDGNFSSINFNNVDNYKAAEIGADINNYDAAKEIGEDKIRSTIKEEYSAWLKTKEVVDYIKSSPGWIEEDVDKYVDKYIEELDKNYHRTDQSTDFYMNDTDTERVFAKDLREYDGATLQYIGIMPKSESLQDYVKNLSVDQVNDTISNMKEIKTENFKEGVVTKVTGYIPFFKYDYDLSLTDDLKELGITDVFDSNKADLSNMLEGAGGQYISSAIHKANIDFSNDGIKAAAVTSLFGAGAGGGPIFVHDWDVPVETIDLTFNKPYFYIIRDKSTGEVWFTGTVYEPTKND